MILVNRLSFHTGLTEKGCLQKTQPPPPLLRPIAPAPTALSPSGCETAHPAQGADLLGAFESFPPQQNHFTGHGPPTPRTCLDPSVLSNWPDTRSPVSKGLRGGIWSADFFAAGSESERSKGGRRSRGDLGVHFPDTPFNASTFPTHKVRAGGSELPAGVKPQQPSDKKAGHPKCLFWFIWGWSLHASSPLQWLAM